MILKILWALVAAALLLIYLAPPVWKLWEPSLGVVVLIGVVLMLIDLWQSLRE